MFITNFIKAVSNLDTVDISNKDVLDYLVLKYMNMLESIWHQHSRTIKISKRSKN